MKKVYLISGKMQSDKNQFADFLQKELEEKGQKVSTDLFAKSLKDGCKNDFLLLSQVLESVSQQIKNAVNLFTDTRENMLNPSITQNIDNVIDKLKIKDENWYEDKTEITRCILQIYGTEIFRNRVDNNWWVNQVKNRSIESDSNAIIVTDCRFPNEITGMYDENYETIIIRINRNINTPKQMSLHDSETALDNWKIWDYVVENNGTLEDLKSSASTIIEDLNKEIDEIGMFTRMSNKEIQNFSMCF